MKKFFNFGKKKDNSDSVSSKHGSMGSRQGSSSMLALSVATEAGYDIKDKDLGKIHKAVISGDRGKVRQLAKKDVNTLDKQHR